MSVTEQISYVPSSRENQRDRRELPITVKVVFPGVTDSPYPIHQKNSRSSGVSRTPPG